MINDEQLEELGFMDGRLTLCLGLSGSFVFLQKDHELDVFTIDIDGSVIPVHNINSVEDLKKFISFFKVIYW